MPPTPVCEEGCANKDGGVAHAVRLANRYYGDRPQVPLSGVIALLNAAKEGSPICKLPQATCNATCYERVCLDVASSTTLTCGPA